MPSTKIIKVSKEDSFSELIDLFKESSAEEVIFVLPKKGKAFSDQTHFASLASEAEKLGKTVTIMAEAPELIQLAQKHNFGILGAKESVKRESKPQTVATVQEDPYTGEVDYYEDDKNEDNQDEGLHEEEMSEDSDEIREEVQSEESPGPEAEEEIEASSEQNDQTYEIVTTAARKTGRSLEGIVKPEKPTNINLKIPKQKPSPVEIEVKKEPPRTEDINTDIEEVWYRSAAHKEDSWQERVGKHAESFWSRIKPSHKLFSLAGPAKGKFKIRFTPKRILTILGVVSAVILGIIIYVSAGSAKITLNPHEQNVDFRLKVTASDKFSELDTTFQKIPGQLFTIEKTAEETFTSSGEKDVAQKARGKITVFNEFSNSPQILIATTRFESPQGLIFRTLTTVTVPGTKVVSGKLVAGTVQVEVIADRPGDQYNIKPSRFSIPAFKEKGDLSRYEKFYGTSSQAMSGGVMGKAKVITEADYNNAKNIVAGKIAQQIEETFKVQTAGLKVIYKPEVSYVFDESGPKIDDAADNFTLKAKGTLAAIGFKESDLNNLIRQYVEKNNSLTVLPDRLSLDYEKIALNAPEGTLQFTVAAKGPAYSMIDTNKIVSELLGKDETQIREYLKGAAGVAAAKVTLSPFWVRKMPLQKEKVTIEVKY